MKKTCILVVGNHRSGTSITASLLSAYLGQTLCPPSKYNPRGYFENAHMLSQNNRALRVVLKTDWDDSAFSAESITSEQSDEIEGLLKDAIAEEYGGRDSIAIKDPRILILQDQYIRALTALGYDIKVISTSRSYHEIAASLATRNHFDKGRSLRLCAYYDRLLRTMASKVPIIRLNHLQLMIQPRVFSKHVEHIETCFYRSKTKYDFIHVIAYSPVTNRMPNIAENIKNAERVARSRGMSMLLLIVIADDVPVGGELHECSLPYQAFVQSDEYVNVVPVYKANTGGLQSAMSEALKVIQNHSLQSNYVVCSEDDYLVTYDEGVLDDTSAFVGSLHPGDIASFNVGPGGTLSIPPRAYFSDKRLVPWVPDVHPKDVVWTSDPYMFHYAKFLDTGERLQGVFTDAPVDEKFDYWTHGICFGEVGFCVKVRQAGLVFTAKHLDIMGKSMDSASPSRTFSDQRALREIKRSVLTKYGAGK